MSEEYSKENAKISDTVDVNESDVVNGLFYVKDIKENTNDIISQLDKLPWGRLTNSANSRMVQHYGYKYNYINYRIDEKCDDLPKFLKKFEIILTNICLQLELIDKKYTFNQCIVNNYHPNQGISPHTDVKDYGSVIGCFTIGSGATMVFTLGNETHELYVEPNSLYIMSGDARYVWKHHMNAKMTDMVKGKRIKRGRRVSITFRNVPNS